MTRSINITESLLRILIIIHPFVLLGSVELGTMNSLDVLPEGAGVGVPLGASWSLAHVGFLKLKIK